VHTTVNRVLESAESPRGIQNSRQLRICGGDREIDEHLIALSDMLQHVDVARD